MKRFLVENVINNMAISSFVITILCNCFCWFLFGIKNGALPGFIFSFVVLLIRLRAIDAKYGN